MSYFILLLSYGGLILALLPYFFRGTWLVVYIIDLIIWHRILSGFLAPLI